MCLWMRVRVSLGEGSSGVASHPEWILSGVLRILCMEYGLMEYHSNKFLVGIRARWVYCRKCCECLAMQGRVPMCNIIRQRMNQERWGAENRKRPTAGD